MTPLALAAKYGHEHVARVLMKEGALLEASSRFYRRPYYHGCTLGRM